MKNLWNKLKSLKSTIILFSIVAICSIIGTLIIQDSNTELLKAKYGIFYSIFHFLGFFDLYNSWWFILLLGILCLSVLACSIDRARAIYNQVKNPPVKVGKDFLSKLSFYESIQLKTSENPYNLVKKSFKKFGYTLKTEGYSLLFYKGSLSRWGVFTAHISFLIIFAGAVIGNIFGFKGYINITEGETKNQAHLIKKNTHIPLGFNLTLTKFEVEFYEKSPHTPKSFKSYVKVNDNKNAALSKIIEVNHPLKYKGITLYQASYGINDKKTKVYLNINDDKKNTIAKISTAIGKTIEIPKTKYSVKPEVFIPDFRIDDQKKVYYSASKEPNNPAVLVYLFNSGELKNKFWLFQKMPEFHTRKDLPYKFIFTGFKVPYYSGLQVAKDPGVPYVYLGFGMMILGLIAALLLYYRRIWVIVEDKKVIIGGKNYRNAPVFKDEFTKIIHLIKKLDKPL